MGDDERQRACKPSEKNGGDASNAVLGVPTSASALRPAKCLVRIGMSKRSREPNPMLRRRAP